MVGKSPLPLLASGDRTRSSTIKDTVVEPLLFEPSDDAGIILFDSSSDTSISRLSITNFVGSISL